MILAHIDRQAFVADFNMRLIRHVDLKQSGCLIIGDIIYEFFRIDVVLVDHLDRSENQVHIRTDKIGKDQPFSACVNVRMGAVYVDLVF